MANIRIDTDGLQNNISSMRAYVNELDSLNARTQSLLALFSVPAFCLWHCRKTV